MSSIVIKDLADSFELDREAMDLVVGGSARLRRNGQKPTLKAAKKPATLWAQLLRERLALR